MTRVAAVDCGTNSIRLLIHDTETGEVSRRNTIVRLGEGVDETGEFAPEAIERTRAALADYVTEMQRENVTRVRMVATSATRDAGNREDFFAMTRELLGNIQPGTEAEVISGEEEAALSFAGATADLDPERGPFCVIDLGGGSTEFVMQTADQLHAVSTQMGCVRITERFMRTDPPTAEETAAARDYINERIAEAAEVVPFAQANTFVGCAGTFTTLSALAQDLDSYDPKRIHMSEISFDRIREVTEDLRSKTAEERRSNPVVHPGRADVIGSGSTVVEQLMDVFEREAGATRFIISEKDILDGIVVGLA
ncbi:exopolyphosphatase / guanosine-5'-triphosphate,3'-diphosphate pyrophosphatase [Corynebacterium coyleae]|uniref:Ppx/GppA family phosphatase n=1 Tax=Corynebacterium coyleae TaxID=53374 RepID=A0ABX8KX69_9CORY|nr:Ppx/GppA phosphatase family protein [Corynebacterium coyleae]QXB18820.1 Ppx/GppA family phosphatase [Corynebacterium coyleae]WJY80371.1 Guanosine-5'-triphosphate,3'-diphosphate pyrophosphatase [Corynebacterium coyleae]SEB41900.1 exopolyphosphatase / guanosine-5'-triphosphate,3'-diphosphate pyrophosphatase [Corynebacterium coyleae]